jgi:hypothetical protein
MTRADADNDGNIEFSIGDCVGQVSSYTDGTSGNDGTQSWTFTRGSGGNAGAMAASTVIGADAIVIDYGVSGQGVLVARANDGTEGAHSPYWQVQTWATSPVAANMALRVRWGQLNGSYGYSTSTYGLAFGDAADVFCAAEATNGFRCMEGGTNESLRLDPSGYLRLGQEGSGKLNTYIDPGVVALRVNTTPWVRLTTAGVEVGQTSSGQGNTFIDTSGNYFARSGTVNRFTIAGSNGNSDWLDDDGTTVRARIGSSAAYFGSLAGERFQFTYGGALEAYNSAGTLYASLSAANGWLLGNWYTTGSNKGYAQMTDRYVRLCKTGVGCTLEFDGDTGGIASTGSLSIQGNATIGGSGSFVASGITMTTTGITATPASSATFDAGKSYKFAYTGVVNDGGLSGYENGNDRHLASQIVSGNSAYTSYNRLAAANTSLSGGSAAVNVSAGAGTGVGARLSLDVTAAGGGVNSLVMTGTGLEIDGNATFSGTCTGTITVVFGLITSC